MNAASRTSNEHFLEQLALAAIQPVLEGKLSEAREIILAPLCLGSAAFVHLANSRAAGCDSTNRDVNLQSETSQCGNGRLL